jgi:hypothetical protein
MAPKKIPQNNITTNMHPGKKRGSWFGLLAWGGPAEAFLAFDRILETSLRASRRISSGVRLPECFLLPLIGVFMYKK